MGVADRREQERQERIRGILDAALHVFAREGLRPATMDAIAREAQLGKGTIYYYFPSKDALLESLVAESSEAYFQGLVEGASGRSTPEGIAQGVIESLLAHYKRSPELFQLIHRVLGEPEPRTHQALETFVRAHRRWLQQLEVKAQAVVERHRVSLEAFLTLIGTYAHGVLFEAVAGRDPDRLLAESAAAFHALFAPQP